MKERNHMNVTTALHFYIEPVKRISVQNVVTINLKIRRKCPVSQTAKSHTDSLLKDLFMCMIVVVAEKTASNMYNLKALSCSWSDRAQTDGLGKYGMAPGMCY